MESKELPLKILVIDQEKFTLEILQQALKNQEAVLDVKTTSSVIEAREILKRYPVNTIFLDPLSLGLEITSKFIFETRDQLPEIVFILYIDKAAAEARRGEFYSGERRRLTHYHFLDKRTPIGLFQDELNSALKRSQLYLMRKVSKATLERLQREAEHFSESKAKDSHPKQQEEWLIEVRNLLSKFNTSAIDDRSDIKKDSVFLSYRFAEEDYIKGLNKLLTQNGFKVITGQSGNSYISKAILDRIKESEFFLCLMTRGEEKAAGTYTTSPWVLEEKGAAIAFGKPLVLMVEEGVTDIGGLQGDWQRIHFSSKGFLNAALDAIEQLKSYQ
jgi:hypothetical protein